MFYLNNKILVDGAKPFCKAKKGDAGYDIWSIESGTIAPGQSMAFKTGIATSFPSDWVGLISDRGSTGWKGLMKQAGIVDSNFRGEWVVKLFNTSSTPIEIESVLINPNAKAMAQVVFTICGNEEVKIVDDLEESSRGIKWLGSSDL